MGECQEVLAGYKDNAKDREKDVVKKEAKPEVICYPLPLLCPLHLPTHMG